MAMNIFKTEGLLGLYAGVTPAVARHIPYTGFRAIGYEYIRAFFCGSAPKESAPLPGLWTLIRSHGTAMAWPMAPALMPAAILAGSGADSFGALPIRD